MKLQYISNTKNRNEMHSKELCDLYHATQIIIWISEEDYDGLDMKFAGKNKTRIKFYLKFGW